MICLVQSITCSGLFQTLAFPFFCKCFAKKGYICSVLYGVVSFSLMNLVGVVCMLLVLCLQLGLGLGLGLP